MAGQNAWAMLLMELLKTKNILYAIKMFGKVPVISWVPIGTRMRIHPNRVFIPK